MMVLMLLFAFGTTICLLAILMPIAHKINLLAMPGAHRYHQGPTPLIGGIAIFLSLLATLQLFSVGIPGYLLLSLFLLVILGIIDDRWITPYWIRLIVQIIVAIILVENGVVLDNLGYLASDELFTLGKWSYILSVISIVGVINAVNMVDGMDGLIGTLLLVTLIAILYLLDSTQSLNDYLLCAIVVSSIAGFLVLNIRFPHNRPAKIFMGDSGSMFLGLFVAWLLISKSQNPAAYFPPVTALWLLAMPLFDTVGVMLRRIARRRSPFHADQLHIHHLLQNLGLSVNQTLILITLAAVCFALIGVSGVLFGVAEKILFYLFVSIFVMYLIFMEIGERAIQK